MLPSPRAEVYRWEAFRAELPRTCFLVASFDSFDLDRYLRWAFLLAVLNLDSVSSYSRAILLNYLVSVDPRRQTFQGGAKI